MLREFSISVTWMPSSGQFKNFGPIYFSYLFELELLLSWLLISLLWDETKSSSQSAASAWPFPECNEWAGIEFLSLTVGQAEDKEEIFRILPLTGCQLYVSAMEITTLLTWQLFCVPVIVAFLLDIYPSIQSKKATRFPPIFTNNKIENINIPKKLQDKTLFSCLINYI